MGSSAHLQALRDLLQSHCAFLPEPPGNLHVLGVAFGLTRQFGLFPASPLEFFAHDPLQVRLTGFLPVGGHMAFACLPAQKEPLAAYPKATLRLIKSKL